MEPYFVVEAGGTETIIVEVAAAETIVVETGSVTVVHNSDPKPVVVRYQQVSSTVILRGEALTFGADDAPIWRVMRISIGYGDQITTNTTHANGLRQHVHQWTERSNYNYF
jgi:hypothetical protein